MGLVTDFKTTESSLSYFEVPEAIKQLVNALLDVHLVVVYKVSQRWMLQLVHSKKAVGITGGINEEMFTSFHRPIGENIAFDFLTDPDQKTPW